MDVWLGRLQALSLIQQTEEEDEGDEREAGSTAVQTANDTRTGPRVGDKRSAVSPVTFASFDSRNVAHRGKRQGEAKKKGQKTTSNT